MNGAQQTWADVLHEEIAELKALVKKAYEEGYEDGYHDASYQNEYDKAAWEVSDTIRQLNAGGEDVPKEKDKV